MVGNYVPDLDILGQVIFVIFNEFVPDYHRSMSCLNHRAGVGAIT